MKLIKYICVAMILATPAAATTLRITITNDRPEAGFALTPIYTAFHNGDFDSYNPGESADGFGGLEQLAELGDFSVARDRRIAETPGSTGGVLAGFGRPLLGGESDAINVSITDPASQRYFSFLSMVVPSNDLFVGNGNPLANELFDADGKFTGARTITLTGADIRDAGTEVNNRDVGVAFAAGQVGTAGAAEGGVVTNGFDQLSQYVGLETPAGFFVSDPGASDASSFRLATITISEVPLPAGGLLLLSALGLAGVTARRKKS